MKRSILLLLVSLLLVVGSSPPLERLHLKRVVHNLGKRVTPLTGGSTCQVLSCANAGQACGFEQTDTSFVETECNGLNSCNYTRTTDANNRFGTCIRTPGQSESCVGTSECVDGYICTPTSQTCVLDTSVATHGPGSPCNADNQCYLVVGVNTTNNCDNGVCRFIPNGQQCQYSSSQCNTLTSFCHNTNQLCTPFLAMDAACDLSQTGATGCSGTCIPTTTTSNSGTCKNKYSTPANKPCTLDSDCSEGLYCGAVSIGERYGLCTAVANTATLHKPCSSDDNCTTSNHEYCGCFSQFGANSVCLVDVVPSGYTAATNALDACARKSPCGLLNGSFNDTCLLEACLAQSCALSKITATAQDLDCFSRNTILPKCSSLAPPATPAPAQASEDTSSGFGLVVSPLLLAAGIYVSLL